MIPARNVLAGIFIGLANDGWFEVLVVSAVWPFIFCALVSITERPRVEATIAAFRQRGQHLVMRSPVLTFYAVECATALVTAGSVALLAHGIKQFVS